MIQEIKWAYQRVVRGYDNRIMWEFDSYFNQFIPPLKKFCEDELIDIEHCKLNKERAKIYKKTLKLIEAIDDIDWNNQEDYKHVSNLWKYFGEHIGYYWN